MKVAVTGGNGFIGRAVTAELGRRGHGVAIIDRSWNSLDVRSDSAADIIMEGDAVIHLAGVLGTGELFKEPEEAVRVNVFGTLNVLKACEAGRTRYVGITMPDVWRNVYQATKRCAGDLASAWHQYRGVEVSHVRAFNVYGPGQKYGSPQKIIPTFAVKAWSGRPIPIWGSGLQTVDLVHVDDVARMLVDVVERPGRDHVYDAGTGTEISVLTVASMVCQAVGVKFNVQHFPMRQGEKNGSRVVATGEGWDELGWHPDFRHELLTATVQAYESVARRLADTLV